LEEEREGDDAGVLFGPFLERISFVERDREGDDIGGPPAPLAQNSSHSFLEPPSQSTKPLSNTILLNLGISTPGPRVFVDFF
jgi:hypothetical protein